MPTNSDNPQLPKILVVDDLPDIHTFYRNFLSQFGFQGLYASDGFEAEQQVVNNPDIKVIMMDIKMPNCDGVECARKLRAQGINTHIVFTSGYNDKYTAEELQALSPYVLSKPFSIQVLLPLLMELKDK